MGLIQVYSNKQVVIKRASVTELRLHRLDWIYGLDRPTVSKTVFVLRKPCSLEHTTDNFCRFWSKIQQDPGTNPTSVSRDTTRSHVVQHTARWLVHALQFSKPEVHTGGFFRGKVLKPKTTRFNSTVWDSRFRVFTLVVFLRFRKRFSFSFSFP